MTLNWKSAQARLGVMVDGIPGRQTYAALLRVVAPRAPTATILRLADAHARHVPDYEQDRTAPRLAEFIAQIANETGGFLRWEENLNYSALALANTWPHRYSATGRKGGAPNALAVSLARRPEAIANATYGLRMGNLPGHLDTDAHPDGWQYRGRGALQLTGRENYRVYGKAIGLDLVPFPELAADPAVSVLIALEFFKRGRVNVAIDRGDFREARRITNGGAIGLEHVAALRGKLMEVLK